MEKRNDLFRCHTPILLFFGVILVAAILTLLSLWDSMNKGDYLHCEWGGKDPNSSGSGQLPLCTG